MNKIFEKKFKDAIDFVKNSGMDSPNKPVIPHALRVGEFLFGHGLSDNVVIAGLLHDMCEWSGTSEEELRNKFGGRVVELINANTKDRSIIESSARRLDQIERSRRFGDDAFAIKIADTIDSFRYYSETGNEKELGRCREWANLLLKHISDELIGKFGEELKKM